MDEHEATIITTPVNGIPVEVRRKRVKNFNLRIRTDGTVALSIPEPATMEEAQAFLAERERWLAPRVPKRVPDASGDDPEATCTATEAWERTRLWGKPLSPDEAPADAKAAAELQKSELMRVLPKTMKRLQKKVGVEAGWWQIRHMKTCWGSCTPSTGAIRINARLASYPPACLEYVMIHELVHLMEPNHGKRFHMLLDVYCPRNRELKQLLNRAAETIA